MAVIKALNRLRESAPQLQFPAQAISQQIHKEAHECAVLHAQVAPLRAAARPRGAAALLARTLDTRLRQSMERLFRLLGLVYLPNEIYNTWLAIQSGKTDRVTAAHDYLDSVLERETKRVVMALLDSSGSLSSHARDLFHIAPKSQETAIGELLRSGDYWIATCAIAAAAELQLKGLAAEIAKLGERAGRETVEVASAAASVLA
jgi:hypothetical protein